MWLAIFGGYYLFTNVIIFQSGHFPEPRTLSIVECTYLMSQVITTVGYGDITPAYPRGQVFVGAYVLMALFVIANVMSDLVGHITESAARYRANMAASAQEEVADEDKDVARSQAALVVLKHAERPSLRPLLTSFAAFAVLATCWILFFHYYPGEEKTWLQAVYFSIITYSTVGFGYFTPVTQGGMVFASFFMIFGSSALVGVVACFTELMIKLGEYERFDPEVACKAINEFRETHKADDLTEADFLRFGLHHTDLVSEDDLAAAKRAFKALSDITRDGQSYVSISALEKSME
jgi:voltage-gated potassium channel Kch